MLRGGSLFYALAISVIIALVSSSLLLAAHFSRLSLQRDADREEVLRNARSGMELLLADQSQVALDGPQEMDLYGRKMDSVQLERKCWGAFEIAICRAHRRTFSKELTGMVGWQPSAEDHTALVLADLDRPLSITGKTELRGDCFLPKAGVQRAYIEGQSYSGEQLVYGQTKNADRFLPPYNDTLVKRMTTLFDFRPGNGDSVLSLQEFSAADSVGNTFHNRALYVWSEGKIFLSQKIDGQVCIISRTMIHVSKNSRISNALLLAPKIEIEDETEGQFQAFARDTLMVGENVHLHYPSVLGLAATKKSPDVGWLSVGKKTKIMGQLFACSDADDFRKQVLISVEPDAKICGEIYSAGLVDLKGEVDGNVTCLKFELKTNSAVYENHLMNAIIDRQKRSAFFASSALTRKKDEHKTIVQWLD